MNRPAYLLIAALTVTACDDPALSGEDVCLDLVADGDDAPFGFDLAGEAWFYEGTLGVEDGLDVCSSGGGSCQKCFELVPTSASGKVGTINLSWQNEDGSWESVDGVSGWSKTGSREPTYLIGLGFGEPTTWMARDDTATTAAWSAYLIVESDGGDYAIHALFPCDPFKE